MPIYLDYFLRFGRLLRNSRGGRVIDKLRQARRGGASSTARGSKPLVFVILNPRQQEHFEDWLLINSTCRAFRAWGKELFFSEKVFVIRPSLMKTLCGATPRIIPENLSIARACIRHVIAPSRGDAASQFIILPRYHTLQNLRSLSIQLCRRPSEILSISNLSTVKRKPLPEEFSTLLGNIGLRVDQLQVDLLYVADEGELQTQIECLPTFVYPYLRTLSAWRAKARIQG
ncbi:hypothetical protein MMC22_003325 [Lobaria immixta]|nr:hypothetical protein [Lobaria immixta]